MQYLLLIYDRESAWKEMPEGRRHSMFAEYGKLTEDIKQSGHYVGGNALQGIDTATSVRVRDGKTSITDGPFAETREQLGGYYLIEAKDLDEATAIAARIPSAQIGTIEVRPIMTYTAQVERAK
ncbi:MAG TPA: YciI family protein [Kofleriaceae bacterium]|jgi:hypothetical protein